MEHSTYSDAAARERYDYHVLRGAERRLARKLVDSVYSTRLDLRGPTSSPPRCGRQQRTLVAMLDGQVVATLTLQSHAFAADEPRIPLELEALYDLSRSAYDPLQVAEVRRVASLPGHRPGVRGLYQRGMQLCQEAGIRAWLGLVEARGSHPAEAPLVHRVAAAHGLVEPPSLPLRDRDAPGFEQPPEQGAAFTRAELRGLPLPGHIASFARALDARAIGLPTLHPCYRRLVLPMRAWLGAPNTRP